jgi:hypothetical protein
VGRDSSNYIALTRTLPKLQQTFDLILSTKMTFFYHYGSKGQGIFTIGKNGAKFKILKCSKQTLCPFPSNLLYVLFTFLVRTGAGNIFNSFFVLFVFCIKKPS